LLLLRVPADVKEVLYSAIDEIGKEKIRIEITADINASAKYCNGIIEKCKRRLDGGDETLGTLCESLLHFMLTAAILPSERKVTFKGAELDIVVPSLRVLGSSPDKCLVIQVIKSDAESAKQAESVHPNMENIWIVSAKKVRAERNYNLQDGSFSKIIPDIHAFLASKGVKNLKLLHG
jgi:hypothetical protein